MGEAQFDWHLAKAASNLRKHGVTFEEASSAFLDERGFIIEEPAIG